MNGLQPGDKAGPYNISRKLENGQGGMATVYEATIRPKYRQSGWPEQFALKVAKLEYEDLLKRECDFLTYLDHPNVVKLYPVLSNPRRNVYLAREQFRTGWRPYFVMEYLDGGSLAERLERQEQMNIRRAIEIAGQMASALAHIHRCGVIHLDIKPENILFRRQHNFLRPSRFHPVLCDFGLARGLAYPFPSKKGGTPEYMSPEQFEETTGSPKIVDHRSDIFSLGVVLYEMLTGQVPFENPAVLLYQDAGIYPSELNGRISPSLEAVIMRCLAKEPMHRYQSGLDLEQDLGAVI